MKRTSIVVISLWFPFLCWGQQQPPNNVSGTNQQPSTEVQNNERPVGTAPEHTSDNQTASAQQTTPATDSPSNIRIANFTKWLVIFAFVQAVIYSIQCYWMKRSLDQSRESSEAQLRAYIILELIQHHLANNEDDPIPDHAVTLRYKNTGQTPAHNIITHVFWDSVNGAEGHLPESYKFPGLETVDPSLMTRTGSTGMLGGGQVRGSAHGLMTNPKGVNFADAYRKFLRDEVAIFFFAKISYRDIFKKVERVTTECVRLEKSDSSDIIRLMSYDTFNEAT